MNTKQCPYCGEEILAAANKCKHCGEWLENAAMATKSSNPKVKKKPVAAIIVGTVAIAAVLSLVLVLAGGKMSDEDLRQAIVGSYSYTETDDSESGDYIETMTGIRVFRENNVYEDIGTSITFFYDDDSGKEVNIKCVYEVYGKYEIQNSYIIFDVRLGDIKITVVESNDRWWTRYFNDHLIPEWKQDLMLDNIEKIVELNDRFLTTEIEYEDETVITTYIRQ